MKTLFTSLSSLVLWLVPSLGFAHGLHAPVEPTAHGLAHALPILVLVGAIAVLAALAWRNRQ